MITKKINNIIDSYLSKKVIHFFKTRAIIRNIDLYIISKRDKIIVYAKDKKYNENLYKQIFSFKKDASIYYLCNLKETSTEFDSILKKYQDNEVK